MGNIKNIVTAANNNYIKYLLVMLKSLFENNIRSNFRIYVLSNDIQMKEKDALERLVNEYKNEIIVLNNSYSYFI